MAIIGRVVYCIILTIIVWFVTRQLYNWPDPSDVVTFTIVSCAIAVTLLILALRQYYKMSAYKARAGMAMNPARFSPDKLDCYVRFQGRLIDENAYALPMSGKACAFYQAEVIAEWETKKRKPDRGMETQRKPLLRKQSPADLEIVDAKQRVYVKAEDFTKSLELHKNEETQKECPEQIRNLAKEKYEIYKITERFACNGDTITAQGRLTRHTDGRLFIEPTGRLKFPSFVAIHMPGRTDVSPFAKEVAGNAFRDARMNQINIAALVVNALLLFYFPVTLM